MTKRYDFEIDDDTGASSIVERQNGDYVEASDYEKLQEENDRLRRVMSEVMEILRDA